MIGGYLEMVNNYPFSESYQSRRVKVDAIKQAIKSMPKSKKIYCETNHMFIKTFFDVVMDEFSEKVEIIILRRNLVRVLKSFIELGYFSERNKVWSEWMSSPNSITAVLPCIGLDSELDQYDLCIAYLLDIEARAEKFQKDYPSARTYEIKLEDLNDFSNINRMFKAMKITPTQETYKIYNKKINNREIRKKEIGISSSLDYCEKRLKEYIEKANYLGIEIPQKAAT
ncbi:hypothetical protein XM38_025180 [Halomicronema hongdechloris C2206]|uniref:Sulfotransferase domain-containing protein n=2 Tax=Halomicronema hongdechloris TaxID=1209493 RepID=A0A1Z3HMS1_9CYAN|nr:hypothetical protein XM38_025180 [Halomicronema hongdechloris C2206]